MTAISLVLLTLALAAPEAKPAKAAAPSGQAAKFKLKPGATGQVCLDCHGDFQDVVKKASVHTPVKSRDCSGCHNPHASDHGKLLAAEPGQVCALCHDVVPANAKSKHKVISDKGCSACHDAHASANKYQLLKPQAELCGSCHKPITDGAAKSKYKHKPLEQQGCVACHEPHGSAKAGHLLKGEVPALCLGCHKTTTPIFAKAHLNYPVAKSNCTSCHDPHGSDKRGMLYNKVHPPVAKMMCGACHEPAGSANPLATKEQAPQLCKACHGPKMAEMLDKKRVHQPVLEGKSCLTCHGPHASRQNGLLRANAVVVCGTCHADTIRRSEKALEKHEPVETGNCAACHDPHGGGGALLFVKQDRVELCAQCHDWAQHSTHPIGAKAIDPRNKNLRLDCLSCHRAHGTEFKKLMPYGTQTELCVKCHETYRR